MGFELEHKSLKSWLKILLWSPNFISVALGINAPPSLQIIFFSEQVIVNPGENFDQIQSLSGQTILVFYVSYCYVYCFVINNSAKRWVPKLYIAFNVWYHEQGSKLTFSFRSQLATNGKILVARSYILVANFIP